MAENKGILIDVGFTTNINLFISKINSELKKIDFDKSINIEKEINKQLNNVAKKIEEINNLKLGISGTKIDTAKIKSQIEELNSIKTILYQGTSNTNTFEGYTTKEINDDLNELKKTYSDFEKVKNDFEKTGSWNFDVKNKGFSIESLKDFADEIYAFKSGIELESIKISNPDKVLNDLKKIENEVDKTVQSLAVSIGGIGGSSGNTLDIPISIRLTTGPETLLTNIQTVLNASRSWLANNPLKAKLEIDTDYQSQRIRDDLKNIRDEMKEGVLTEESQEKVNSYLEDIGTRFSKGLELKLNKEQFEQDAEIVRDRIITLRDELAELDKEITIQPKIKLGEDEIENFKTTFTDAVTAFSNNLRNVNSLIDQDALIAVERLSEVQGGFTLNNMEQIINGIATQLVKMSDSSQDLQPLATVLQQIIRTMVAFNQADSLKDLNTQFAQLRSSITIPTGSENLLEKIANIDISSIEKFVKEINKLSQDGKLTLSPELVTLANTLKNITISVEVLKKYKTVNIPSVDFESEKSQTAIDSFKTLLALLDDVQATKENISASISIPGIENLGELNNNKLNNATKKDANELSSITNQVTSLNNALSNGKLENAMVAIGTGMMGLNQDAGPQSIISVFNELLNKESAINALANLFSGSFVQKLTSQSSLMPKEITDVMKSSMLDEFYSRAQQMPELLNKAFTGGQTGILEYTKGLEGLFDAYTTILGDRLNPQAGIISKEEYQGVKEYMSALVTDIQTEMSHIFDNLYATASPSLRRQLDLVRNDLINAMPKGLTQEGNLEKTKESLISYQEVLRNVNNTLSDSNSNILNGFYEKAAKLPDIFKNVISNNSVSNVKEYKDSMADLLSLYQALVEDSKRGNNRIFSKEEFSEAKSFLQGTIKEMNTEINNLLKNMTAGLSKNGKATVEQEFATIKSIIPKNLSNVGSTEDIGNVASLLETAQKKIDDFTNKSERAKQTLDGLKEKIKTVGTESSQAFASGETLGISKLISQLVSISKQIAKVREAADKGFISEKAVQTTEQRANAIGTKIQKALTKAYGEDVASVLPENAISNAISQIALTGSEQSVNQFKTIMGTLKQKITESAKMANVEVPIDIGINESALEESAKQVEQIAMKTQRLQKASFKGDDENLYHFLETLKALDLAYTQLKEDQASFEEATGKSISSENYEKLISNIDNVYSKLKTGFSDFLKEQKGTPIDAKADELRAIVNELNGLFNQGNIVGETESIQSAMLGARDASSKVFSDSNIMANGLSFSKLLGRIYNDMANNSSMSGDLRKRFQELANEMEGRGAAKTSNTQFGMYAKAFQNLDTEMKRTGQTGKSFFATLKSHTTAQTAQYIAMTFSFYRMISMFKQGVQTATEFNTALAKISYTMDVSDAELNNMGKSILNLSKDLKTSVSSMEQIYTIYANMNTSSAEVEQLSKYTAILANLSGIDASTAADDIQAVVNQFEGLSSVDTSHIVDVYDYISRNISVDYSKGIEGMAEGVQAVGNVADQAGLSYEQLSSIIAKTMEQTRNSGSSIANGLKTIMVRLSKASTMDDEVDNSTLSKASAVLHDIGVEVYTAEGEFREFDTIMTELAGKWDSLTEAQQANISFQIAATRQTATLKAILSNWTDSMDMATEATKTNGNALENQEKYADTYAAKIQEMKNAFSELSINFFTSEAFEDAIDVVEDLSTALSGLLGKIGLIPTALIAINIPSLIKHLGAIKNTIIGLPSLGQALGAGKNGLATAIAANGAFNGKAVTEYAMALNGLSANQAKVAVTTSALSASQKEAVMAMYAQQQAALSLSAADFELILLEKGVSSEDIKTIQSKLAASGSINTLTEARIREALSINAVNETLREEIVLQATSNSTTVASVGIIGNLKNAWNGLAATIGLTGGQLAKLIAGITAAYFVFKKWQELNVTFDEYVEGLEGLNQEAESSASELSSLNEELNTTKLRLKELQRISASGNITITEKEELETLKAENDELERKIANQKELAQENAKKALEEAKKDPSHGYNTNIVSGLIDDTLYYDTTSAFDINDAVANQIKAIQEASDYNIEIDEFESVLNDQLRVVNDKIAGFESYINEVGELSDEESKAYDRLKESYMSIMAHKYDSTGAVEYYNVLDDADKIERRYEDVYNKIKGMQSDNAYADEQFTKNIAEQIINKAQTLNGVEIDGFKIDLTSADFSFKDIELPDDFADLQGKEKAEVFVDAWIEAVKEQFKTEELGIEAPPATFEDAWKGLDNLESDDPLNKLKEELSALAEAGKLTEKTFYETNGAKTWLDEIQIPLEEVLEDINSLYTDIDRLSGLKSDVNALREAYGEKRDNIDDEEAPNAVGADTLKELEDIYGTVTWTDETGAIHEKTLESWERYKNVAGSTKSTLKELKDATDDLLTEYYNEGNYMEDLVDEYGNVDEAAQDYYIGQLKEMGIANAEHVVEIETLNRQAEAHERIARSIIDEKLEKMDLTTATDSDIAAIAEEISKDDELGISLDRATQLTKDLIAQKLINQVTGFGTEDDITYLNKIID